MAPKHDFSYKTIPALAAYIDRIGAEELNFKRFMIKDYRGNYYTERSLIKINDDGTITCSNPMYAPTEDEEKMIKGALLSANFPKSIRTSVARSRELRKTLHPSSTAFDFLSKEGEVIMVQERAVISGSKVYLPWTYWSDGKWRRMEPEGALPFWKPCLPEKDKKARIMVHEGAKAADFVTAMVKSRGKCDYSSTHPDWKRSPWYEVHPWYEELKNYEHWGMIGGALAPHRTDYAEIISEKPKEMVYVCDNDFPGKAALQEVSRHYGGSMKGVTFDKRWPESWDLADPMPQKMFSEDGRYLGPALSELMIVATRATERIVAAKGKATVIVKPAFAEEWYHCIRPEVFIHRDYANDVLTLTEFNSQVRPFSDVDDTGRLLKAHNANKSFILKYDPSSRPGVYSGDEVGGRFINTHCPTRIVAERGDPAPWVEFMEHLIPREDDRRETYRWLATLIARPDVKMTYGILLISEMQGVGKGTLGEKILAPLVGLQNVSYPSENEIVDSNYNYWLAHRRLAVVHEIYAGHSSKAYNRLKSTITDKYIEVSKKYQANYQIENWMHVFACSNSIRAIMLSADDRRWFVPKVTEKKRNNKYWTEFNQWLNFKGGLQIIKWWAEEWLRKNDPVAPGADAPSTDQKKEVIEEGYSPGMTLVAGVLRRLRSVLALPSRPNGKVDEERALRKTLLDHGMIHILREGEVLRYRDARKIQEGDELVAFVMDSALVNLIRNKLHDGRQSDKLERPSTVRKVAKADDWSVGKHKSYIRAAEWGGQGSRMLCSSTYLADMNPVEMWKPNKRDSSLDYRLFPVDPELLWDFSTSDYDVGEETVADFHQATGTAPPQQKEF